jgi:hypothetical protein
VPALQPHRLERLHHHAVVFAADEKTRDSSRGSLAALSTRTGENIYQTVPRHTSDAFVVFPRDVSRRNRVDRRSTSSSITCRRTK